MLSEGTNTVMPVSPMGAYGDGMGMGGFGGWWVLLFWFAMMGGWGNGMWGNGNNVADTLSILNNTNRGFDNAQLSNQIQSVQNSVDALGTRGQLGDIQNSLNALQMSMQQCCCENRLATSETNNNITAQAAENRYAAAQNTQQIVASQNAGTQAILDKLCQLEIDGIKAERDSLRSQLQAANLQASQTAQTAQLMADNAAQTQYVVNRIAPYPVPSYTVSNPYAGINNCGYNCGCGS